MGIAPNFQTLRTHRAAGLLRRGLYAALVGDGNWPPVLARPAPEMRFPAPSGNVYVHVPFCETLCPHCPYAKSRYDTETARAYARALRVEIRDYLDRGDVPPVTSLYFGGGTPSLTPEIVAGAVEAFADRLAPGAEIACEVHPRHATPAGLDRLRAAGVERISLAIESFDAATLRRLARGYGPDEARAAIDTARAAGFAMLDVNLIFAVPGLTRAAFRKSLAEALARGADQISAYPLFTFGHTAAGQPGLAGRYAEIEDALRLAMQRDSAEFCRAAGLERSSVWSFTRRGHRPYTTVTRPDYVGFGAAAGSKTRGAMWFNTFSVPAYVAEPTRGAALIWRMGPRLARTDWLYWRIYCGRVGAAEYEAAFGHGPERDFGIFLGLMRASGMMRRDGADHVLTERGAIWVHRLQSLFSLSGIDRVWTACGAEPWPRQVRLG